MFALYSRVLKITCLCLLSIRQLQYKLNNGLCGTTASIEKDGSFVSPLASIALPRLQDDAGPEDTRKFERSASAVSGKR